ncbi:PREDICTED: RNA polymerase II subunit 5-mediating protein homolog isoform X2 [Nelumbo nucifera]|uniref:RNA polymerase II subunit 5-mediating protein homolog isoform X2 n=1 Tax=Nelumbo nucifera TaxID=4432 RepID=A0A1U8A1H8_NELNU|nr:PREDICTED: RNA polymerase II subunit 5-mediating protein homolog isoform X2 [Nelumbo nucifera]XP_010258587.1 PREDICTED: RNA polymerase II subunit 5-mediating protein homolog isoform X2 [Nelumbo nucifera]XP_010258588.1 PREDICTED: RNA polymerase II subunit 5-mediating protein homolog isoform X2 [Nelumbo nucifera]XP_010258589.1 PREDICTED: RNA polymerase II subunit 5-mediating protein homolog isoform X2 [Nelumbo nucifera]
MVMEEGVKGTITSLSSIFPVEEAQKAAKRVQDAIADRQKELEHLHSFISDNINLVNLVQKLPDELFHDVMVPFGKAAFFPGRLVHSNEFLVLLGEGYYAERTCKQTIEILQRRGKFLESQVESLKANLMDLKAEASFFDATAAEAAEGLVEIREDYVEENPAEKMPKSGLSKPDSSEAENVKLVAEDEEYARIMSRLDELEKEELAAQSANEDDDEEAETDFGCSINQESFDDHFKSLELRSQVLQSKVKTPITTATKEPLGGNFLKQDSSDHPPLKVQFEDSKIHYVPKAYNMEKSEAFGKPLSVSKEKIHAASVSTIEGFKDTVIGHPEVTANYKKVSGDTSSLSGSKTSFDSSKAFTGSIIEHAYNSQTKPAEQTVTSSQSTCSRPTKPVSRFKMQKGGR